MPNRLLDHKWHHIDATDMSRKMRRKSFTVETCRMLSNHAETVAQIYLRGGAPALMLVTEGEAVTAYEADDSPLLRH